MLIKIISFNLQQCSFKAVAGNKDHYKEFKERCDKFQPLLCKTSATEEQLKQKKKRQTIIVDVFTIKDKQHLCNMYTCLYMSYFAVNLF